MTAARSVLITGANGDIGRSLARTFAEHGARLALCDLATPDAAEPLLTDLKSRGVTAFYRQVDVTAAPAMLEFVAEAGREHGGLDICLANAGIVERGDLIDISVEAWRRTLDVNLTGCFVTAQAAARAMITGGRVSTNSR